MAIDFSDHNTPMYLAYSVLVYFLNYRTGDFLEEVFRKTSGDIMVSSWNWRRYFVFKYSLTAFIFGD